MLAKVFSFRNIVILLLLLMIGITAYLTMQNKEQKASLKAQPNVRKPALTVIGVTPSKQMWPQEVKLQGAVYPWQEAIVSSEISGLRIIEVNADIGQQIKRGQVLVRLADETVNAAYTKQEATLEREKAALAEAIANADRARKIKETGALSTQKINQYLIAEQTAKANLAFAQAELTNQAIRRNQTTITAPDAGLVTARTAKLGNVVTAGQPLFTLMRQNRIEWRAELNADAISQIKKDQAVTVNGANSQTLDGKVRLIAPTINDQSRNGIAYVDLPKGSSKPGMYHTGSIVTGEASAMTLPQSAITLRDGMAYVFALQTATDQNTATVKQVKVSIGRTVGEKIEIRSGISALTQYVKTGGAFLNDGDLVGLGASPEVLP